MLKPAIVIFCDSFSRQAAGNTTAPLDSAIDRDITPLIENTPLPSAELSEMLQLRLGDFGAVKLRELALVIEQKELETRQSPEVCQANASNIILVKRKSLTLLGVLLGRGR